MIGLRSADGFGPRPAQLAARASRQRPRGAVRGSPHVYNTTTDLERLVTVLRRHF
jgi:selenocysteine lyase/cysteine desulfurase